MKEEDIPQNEIDRLLSIMADDGDDSIQYNDYESPSGQIANREVVCPSGYIFHVFIIIPQDEQMNYEKSGRALDKQTEKSFRYLLSRGRSGLRELL